MDMCNLLKRMLPLSQPSNNDMRADVARQNLSIKDCQDSNMDVLFELGVAHSNKRNLILTTNNGTELAGVTSIDGVVNIPEGVTRIREQSFYFYDNIEVLIIPSSVNTIDDGAFCNLRKIETIQVHKDNKSFIVINGVLYNKDLTRVIKATRHCIMKDIPVDIKQIDSWAYAYCCSVVDINIPYGVTEIGKSAFRKCEELKKINFTNRMSTLKEGIFDGCSVLAKVVLPKGLRVIESNAFSECTRFREMMLPDSLETIERLAFQDCNNLERVQFGSMVKSISPLAFDRCESLKNFEVDEDNEKYCDEDGVLYNLTEKILMKVPANFPDTSFTIKEGVAFIAPYAFDGCKDIREIEFPDSLKGIGKYAFLDCEDLDTVHLPDSVKVIGEGAFSGCKSLGDLKLPAHIRHIKYETFRDCYALHRVDMKDTDITCIEESAFADCRRLNRVLFPETLQQIDMDAFESCPIKYVEIPKSVTDLSSSTFFLDYSLKDIKVEENDVYDTENSVLYEKTSKTLMLMPALSGVSHCVVRKGTIHISNGAFSQCKELQSIKIPRSVKEIGTYAFEKCTSLKQITLDAELCSIQENTFDGCQALTTIKIPQTVQDICESAFRNCYLLRKINLPQSLKSIGYYAFQNCVSITSLSIPDDTEEIRPEAFKGCISLEKIQLPKHLSKIAVGLFEGCHSLHKIIWPQSITEIGEKAFAGCESLQKVEIPSKVYAIGHQAFQSCSSLSSVTLPESLAKLGKFCFLGCEDLREIVFKNLYVKGLNKNCMDGVDRNRCTVYVPKGGLNIFMNHPALQGFKIVETK